MTVLYGLRVAVVYLLLGIHDNLSDIKPQRVTTRYPIIFHDILPLLKRHRNDLAHKVNHATDAIQIEWLEIWGILERLMRHCRTLCSGILKFLIISIRLSVNRLSYGASLRLMLISLMYHLQWEL
jgi:hypothetical protein